MEGLLAMGLFFVGWGNDDRNGIGVLDLGLGLGFGLELELGLGWDKVKIPLVWITDGYVYKSTVKCVLIVMELILIRHLSRYDLILLQELFSSGLNES